MSLTCNFIEVEECYFNSGVVEQVIYNGEEVWTSQALVDLSKMTVETRFMFRGTPPNTVSKYTNRSNDTYTKTGGADVEDGGGIAVFTFNGDSIV